MAFDPSPFLNSLLGAVGTWVAGLVTTGLAGIWKHSAQINARWLVGLAILSFGVSVGALIAAIETKQPPALTQIIAGHWNGKELDSLSSGSKLKGSLAGSYVRISFEGHGFKKNPVVLITPAARNEGVHAEIKEIKPEYVDVRTQTFEQGAANGYQKTDIPFWFSVVPAAE